MRNFNTFNGLDTSVVDLTDKAKLSLYKKSSNSGISVDILEEVYRRGYSIWNEQFGGTADSFAFDRVNSFIAGGFAAQLDEDLRNWFNPKHPEGGWKRIDSKGNVVGPCAREPGEPKPKCMSNKKRSQLSKKERAAAVASKRRHDPVADRSGKGNKPVNVSNFGKGKISEEYLEEKNVPTNPSLWSKAKSLARSKFDVYPSAYANGWASKWYKSKGGGWKSVSEEYTTEQLNVKTPSIEMIAKKFGKSTSEIRSAVRDGVRVEKEHTKNTKSAEEIARDHLGERPDYYKKLRQAEKGPIKEDNISAEKRSKDPNKSSNRFIGTDELTKNYRERTPGQIVKESIHEYKIIREQSLDDDTINAIAREANPNNPDSVRAVLHVVHNRMGRKGYADTPRGVMSQPEQFAAWGKGPAKGVTDEHKNMIKNIWSDVLAGKSKDPTGGANEFRTSSTTKHSGLDIGGNRFFKTGSYLKGLPPRPSDNKSIEANVSFAPKQNLISPSVPTPPRRPTELTNTDMNKKVSSIKEAKSPAWQRKEGKNPEGGLNRKGVESYRRENPGSKLQTAVTEKNPSGKRAARRKSFCARMSGMKRRLTSAKTANDPNSRINKSLRKWNC